MITMYRDNHLLAFPEAFLFNHEVLMDKTWTKIISITGAVGVVGLLFSILMNNVFNTEIVTLLGSEKLFFILVLLVCCFSIALFTAIIKSRGAADADSSNAATESKKNIKVTYDNGSTHNGDNNF